MTENAREIVEVELFLGLLEREMVLGSFNSGAKIQPNFFEIELSISKIELYACEYSDSLFKECINY